MTLSYQCILCRHYLGEGTCRAFLDGIPDEILSGEFDHTQPHEGDKGIQFEEAKNPADRFEGLLEDTNA